MRGYNLAKNVLLSLLILVLTTSLVAGEVTPVGFSVDVEPIDDRITGNEAAEFKFLVKNMQDFTDTFKLEPLEDLHWSMQSRKTLDYQTGREIEAYGEDIIYAWFKSAELPDGDYQFKLTFLSKETNATVDIIVKIHVGAEPIDYNPDFRGELEMPSQMDPRNKYLIKVHLHNNNLLSLENINVKLSSKLINEETLTNLPADETKTISFTIGFPEGQEPANDRLRVLVTHKGKTFYDSSKDFSVVEYLPPFKKEVDDKGRFLRFVKTMTFTNEGNNAKEGTVTLETGRFSNIFTSTNPKTQTEEVNGKLSYVWRLNLEPGQSATIIVKINYWWLVLLAVLLIGGIAYYQLTKNPIVVRKETRKIDYEHEAISEAKILIHVKNRTNSTLSDVKIIERIPSLAGIKKGCFEHTLKPKKAYNHGSQHIIEYHLDELDPHEERVLSYQIKSKLHILGELELKPTVVKFKDKQGKRQRAVSNNVVIPALEAVEQEE